MLPQPVPQTLPQLVVQLVPQPLPQPQKMIMIISSIQIQLLFP